MWQHKVVVQLLLLLSLSQQDIKQTIQVATDSWLRDLCLMVKGKYTKIIFTDTAVSPVRCCIIRDKEGMRLKAAEQQIDELVTTVESGALPSPAKVRLDD